VRYLLFAAVLFALPLDVSAQRHAGHARQGGAPQTNTTPQHPPGSMGSLGLPLPPIGLPPSPQQLPAWKGARQTPWWEHQGPPAWERQQRTPVNDLRLMPGWNQGNVARAMLDQQHAQQQLAAQIRHGQVAPRQRSHNYQSSVVYVLPTYGYSGLPVADESTAPAAPAPTPSQFYEPRVSLGLLRLEVEPREALQIYVDGVFVGTPSDLGDELEMPPGPHQIELRARGYKSLAFDVGILDGRSITYRGALERDASAPPPPPPAVVRPTGSRTMYVIPGCYMGNISPKEVSLPAGCDIKKMSTISPQ
jgi:hypothetical protein